MSRTREVLKHVLRKVGLLESVRALLRLLEALRDPRQRTYYGRYLKFKMRHGRVLRHRLYRVDKKRKIAVVSSVHFPEVEIEFAVIKALELAGFTPVLLIERDEWLLRKYYKLAAIDTAHMWEEFSDKFELATAEAAVSQSSSLRELMEFEYGGVRVGRFAISTAMRGYKVGSFDLKSRQDREILVRYVAYGMTYTSAAQRILDTYDPALAVFIDKGYSPKGELFDNCLARGIDCVSWDLAHRNSALMFKRFNVENRDTSTDSISSETWEFLRKMPFADTHREQLEEELYSCYASGDWYSVAGTQFNKRLFETDVLRKRLNLVPGKKTAIIFPHVSWDATLFWGKALYKNYEEWLVDTVRAACANDRVNWIVKIHPAHIGKAVREGFRGEPAEVITLRKYIGDLPAHVSVIPAESDISTFSLFNLMDYCVTVRGRVGIEAAKCGIPVLTAGKGPYDHRGFTVDPESREEYLETLTSIDTIPPLSSAHRELAERFAYGFYLLRPLRLTSATLTYHESHEKAASKGRINIKRKKDWYQAADIKALAGWLNNSSREDFLVPFDAAPTESACATNSEKHGSRHPRMRRAG